MTREEAIEIMLCKIKPCVVGTTWNEAIDMAIEALQSTMNQERVNHESTNDLISRADAIEAVCTWGTTLERNGKTMMTMVDVKHAFIKTIEELPSADRPSGEWEDKEIFDDMNDDHIVEEWQSARCSECGKYHTTPYMYYFDNFNYCPNCGADMRGGDTE